MKKKMMFSALTGVMAVCAGTAGAATVTVDNVTALTNVLLSGSANDIVVKPGVYDLSTIAPKMPREFYSDEASSTDDRIAHLIVKRNVTVRGENTKHWDGKTREEETVFKGNDTAILFYGFKGDGRKSKFLHITFENGNATTGDKCGGGLYFMGNSSGYVSNCVFRSCKAAKGGGTYAVSAYDCLYENCGATQGGGAYAVGVGAYNSPTNVISGCVFRDCSAVQGGGLYANQLSAWGTPNAGCVENCVFSNNVAKAAAGERNDPLGGGLYMYEAGLVRNCRFERNHADQNGGAVLADNKNHTGSFMTNCVFVANSSGASGGAVWLCAKVEDCVFTDNVATNEGGAVAKCLEVRRSVFEGNMARTRRGGAGWGDGAYYDCRFHANTSGESGGALSLATVSNCVFDANTAKGMGGAVIDTTAYDSSFVGNEAVSNRGGAGYGGSFERCAFTNNHVSANARGAAVAFANCRRCVFSGVADVSVGSFDSCDFDGVVQAGYRNWVIDSVRNMGGSTYVTNCLIRNCETKFLLGNSGLFMEAVNCTFVNNKLKPNGAAIVCYSGVEYGSPNKYHASTTTVVNCLFANNRQTDSVKTVLDLSEWVEERWENVEGVPNKVELSHCLYESESDWTQTAGLTAAEAFRGKPRFAGAGNPEHPFAITGDSAARNAGVKMDWMLTATDFAGNARVFDGAPDIGCYETRQSPSGTVLLVR